MTKVTAARATAGAAQVFPQTDAEIAVPLSLAASQCVQGASGASKQATARTQQQRGEHVAMVQPRGPAARGQPAAEYVGYVLRPAAAAAQAMRAVIGCAALRLALRAAGW